MTDGDRKGGISKGTRHNAGISHREAAAWVSKAAPNTEIRAGKGLYLRKTLGGAFWFFRYVSPVTGKQVRAELWGELTGEPRIAFPDATVEVAGFRAARLRADVASGIDPLIRSAQERADRARAEELQRQEAAEALAAARAAVDARARRLTVRGLFDLWRTSELQPQVAADGRRTGRKDGGAFVLAQFERHVFPAVGSLAVEEVRKGELLALIDAQKAKGQLRTAAMLLSDLRQMFDFAAEREHVEANPLASVKKARIVGRAVERERVLSLDELRDLADALPSARMNKRSEAAIWLLLATGARIGEMMGAIWADSLPTSGVARRDRIAELKAIAEAEGAKLGIVDLDARKWHLPTTKNQREHTIHLSAFAVRHFTALKALRMALPDEDTQSPWAFPSRDATKPVCVKSFGKQLADRQRDDDARLSGRSKATSALSLPGGRWTAHDLRRTAGTLMATLGISGDVIDECLNHMIESRVRRVYVRDRREQDQQRAFDALGARLAALTLVEPASANVIAMRLA